MITAPSVIHSHLRTAHSAFSHPPHPNDTIIYPNKIIVYYGPNVVRVSNEKTHALLYVLCEIHAGRVAIPHIKRVEFTDVNEYIV